MKISVIIPTYKPKNYLWECLASLKNQTFSKEYFEVILVLNGCIEPWKSQIESYIIHNMQGVNVNFVHTPQGGVSNARNIALDVAKGDYVTFIDDDDYVSSRFLEGLYEKAAKDTIVLCYPYGFYDGKPEVQVQDYSVTIQYEKLAMKGKMFYTKARKFFSGPCMKLIPMTYIHDRRYNPQFKNGEDSLFMFLISDQFRFVDFAGKDIRYYRRYRENSAFTAPRKISSKIYNTISVIQEYCIIYFKNPSAYNLTFFLTRIIGALHSIL